MIILYFICIGIIAGLMLYVKRIGFSCKPEGDKTGNIFLVCGYYLVFKWHEINRKLKGYGKKADKKEEILQQLSCSYRNKEILYSYYASKISILLLIIFSGSVLAAAMELKNGTGSIDNSINSIKRNEQGQGEHLESLLVSAEDVLEKEPYSIVVGERAYTDEEVEERFSELLGSMDEMIIGENESLIRVDKDLKLPGEFSSGIQVLWNLEPYGVLDEKGRIIKEDIDSAGETVILSAQMYYRDSTAEYKKEIKVFPPSLSAEQEYLKRINDEIILLNEGKEEFDEVELPVIIDGQQIIWELEEENTPVTIFFLFIISAAAIWFGKDQDLNRKKMDRERQLLRDYPEIVSKLSLLMGAGMTISGAFAKIASDYSQQKTYDEQKIRYAYEEILLTHYELESGISNSLAIESFGTRCKQAKYISLSSMLVQNLKKGTSGLSEVLGRELIAAMEERKNAAKKLGEEAASKLLVPMILMLIVVLIILVLPAFLSIQIV